jgi:flavin-dependent dehydrogenase
MQHNDYDVAVIGGGPAGSIAGLYLSRMGFSVCVIEKKEFPREVLCGEFLSREVSDILTELGLREQFLLLKPNPISSFRFCPEYRRTFSAPLPFTGYGLKRGAFDMLLLQAAQQVGAVVIQPAAVDRIVQTGSGFEVNMVDRTEAKTILCKHVITAYGKYNVLDKTIRRIPPHRFSSLHGIKFHVPKHLFVNYPGNEIQIFTTEQLYCGVNIVNEETATVCILEKRSREDRHPRERLADLINTNRHFRQIVHTDFVAAIGSFPIYGTSNIYFGKKSLFENGMMMIGDAAQVIAPLAGDGIGMAMQCGKLAAESIEEGRKKNLCSDEIMHHYSQRWHSAFHRRLWTAGMVQKIFLTSMGRAVSTTILSVFPGVLPSIIEHTRG